MKKGKEFNTTTFEGQLQIVPNEAHRVCDMERSTLRKIESCLGEFNIYPKKDDVLIKIMAGDNEITDWNTDGIPPRIVKMVGSDNLLYNMLNRQLYPLFPKYLPLSILESVKEDDVLTLSVGEINIDLTCTQGNFKEFGKFEEVLKKVLDIFITKEEFKS